ncbi:MAG: M23 family metallopeptidase [Candidatus Uhrbacteria bacterium]|nr:M23 family metallopeptidase [Candidatus Uhrbacteria bacterium]
MLIKPHFLRFTRRASDPFRSFGRIFVSFIVLPIYRLTYALRRHFGKMWKPARNKLMFLVSNKYSVHIVVVSIAIMVGVLNLQTNEVRAETFGEQSLMYSLVSQQGIEIFEEYAGVDATTDVSSVSYREQSAISSFARGVDSSTYEDVSSLSLISGGTISAPAISESAASNVAREEIETYVVESGDTLSSIAEGFGINVNTLLWANDLTVRSVLQLGDELVILPVSGAYHTVKSGDTLSRIASNYDVTADEILSYNKLASADDLVIGEKLIIPGGSVSAPVISRSTAFSQVFSPTTSTTTTSTSASTVGSGTMIWPTDLRVITQYFGWAHTGLDVDCGYTNDNYAADDGIVEYSGWKGGYGNTVDINHGNGIVTRYGHHASLYVSAGQQVSKGQAIGRCGTTGRSTGTHLHFEVISGGRFMNPLEYIR